MRLLAYALAVAIGLSAPGFSVTPAGTTDDGVKVVKVVKSHQWRCTDKNTSLYFLVYENNGNLTGGQMYVENMQAAVLTVENAGNNVIKASVNGNTAANIAFQLHKKPGSVMIANYGPNPNRVEVCKATYTFK